MILNKILEDEWGTDMGRGATVRAGSSWSPRRCAESDSAAASPQVRPSEDRPAVYVLLMDFDTLDGGKGVWKMATSSPLFLSVSWKSVVNLHFW